MLFIYRVTLSKAFLVTSQPFLCSLFADQQKAFFIFLFSALCVSLSVSLCGVDFLSVDSVFHIISGLPVDVRTTNISDSSQCIKLFDVFNSENECSFASLSICLSACLSMLFVRVLFYVTLLLVSMLVAALHVQRSINTRLYSCTLNIVSVGYL